MATPALAKSRRAAGRRPARPGLNRRRVLEAALAVVDRDGLDELTIRRLGIELGVEGMSLYKHVADKDAVLDGVVELLWAEVPASPGPETEWHAALRQLADGLRAMFRRHPRAAPLLVTRNFLNPAALRCYDAYLNVLYGAGFERRPALDALCAVAGQAFGYSLVELRCAGPQPEGAQPESQIQLLRRITQALPPDLPDSLVELAMELSGFCEFDRCFEVGVSAVIAGLHP